MKFLIVEPPPLPILIHLGPKIFASGSCFQIPLACVPPHNVRDHVSHPYSITGSIIVLYIFIFKFFERSREVFGLKNQTGPLSHKNQLDLIEFSTCLQGALRVSVQIGIKREWLCYYLGS